MSKTLTIALLAATLLARPAAAQTPIPAPPQPGAFPLYPGAAQTAETESWLQLGGQPVVRNVTRPTLTPVLPPPARATGAAVIVAPGGGYQFLAMRTEGWAVANWLAEHGIAAFVLKYRIEETPPDPRELLKATSARFTMLIKAEAAAKLDPYPPALADMQAAVRLIRADAARWNVDPRRIGLLGFSAGARTALAAATHEEIGARPDFVGALYGPTGPIPVPRDAPPLFMALAADDPLFGGKGYGVVDSWQKARRPIEFHLYERGGHGFGMGQPGNTNARWIDAFYSWLDARGLLRPTAAPAKPRPVTKTAPLADR